MSRASHTGIYIPNTNLLQALHELSDAVEDILAELEAYYDAPTDHANNSDIADSMDRAKVVIIEYAHTLKTVADKINLIGDDAATISNRYGMVDILMEESHV